MKKNRILNITLLLAAASILIVPLATIKNSEFGGADGAAEEMVLLNNPSYEPWYSNFWEPPGPEVETLLFSLQAALGASVVAYGLGYFVGTRKKTNDTN